MRWDQVLPAVPVGLATLGYLVLPIMFLVKGSFGHTDAGFGRGTGALSSLMLRSIVMALVPAVAATTVGAAASLVGESRPGFSVFYRVWLFIMLFTNPVFLVFGFSVLLAKVPSTSAVILASTYILMPLCGLVVQAGVDEFDDAQAHAARSLGASPVYVALSHILPSIRLQILAATLLSTIYALGFFLTPAYVGLGRTVTLGTVINDTTNAVGDWTAGCQLCIVAVAAQVVVVLLWMAVASVLGLRSSQ
jgi:ABC-type spermidine/putrescine transport system permease subunit II